MDLGIDQRLGRDIFSGPLGNIFQVMVNHVAVDDFNRPLAEGDIVVMFPPMAGG
jgi:molybdopterin converting factor small subunit